MNWCAEKQIKTMVGEYYKQVFLNKLRKQFKLIAETNQCNDTNGLKQVLTMVNTLYGINRWAI